MNHDDRRQQASHVGQIDGVSGRQRILMGGVLAVAAVAVIWLAIPARDGRTSADVDPSGRPETAAPAPASNGGPTPSPSPSPAPEAPLVPPSGPWGAQAVDQRGAIDQRFTYVCPGNGTLGPIWGSAVYTDDSSVCTAAVHMGFITAREGGAVQIVMRAGLSSYTGTTLNGVISQSWPAWDGSFEVVGMAEPLDEEIAPPMIEGPWGATASEHRGAIGTGFRYECPPDGVPGPVWGTDTYTDDSSVCTAAVHAGRITLTEGGTVTIEMRPGRSSYVGSTRNGVNAVAWGRWDGSFIFVGA